VEFLEFFLAASSSGKENTINQEAIMAAETEDIKQVFVEKQNRLSLREQEIYGRFYGVGFEGRKHQPDDICTEFHISAKQLNGIIIRARKKLRE
jgi:hypothetical protein